MRLTVRSRLALVAGGAMGTLARWALAQLPQPGRLPVGTLAANVLGALLLGALVGRLGAAAREGQWTPVTAGLLGAATTFSTFVLEVVQWWPDAHWAAVGYLVGTIVLGLAAAWAGARLGRARGTGP